MAEPKCSVHEEQLVQIKNRLERIEDDLDSIVSENRSMTTGLAVAERSFSLFQDIVARLEARIETLEKRIEAMLKDRWQILAGLFTNAGLIGMVMWMMERKP
jgi:tetrahydromethanopterin S-methyltransferase subunit G